MPIAAIKRVLRDVLTRIMEEERKPASPNGSARRQPDAAPPHRHVMPDHDVVHYHGMPYGSVRSSAPWSEAIAAANARGRLPPSRREERYFPIGFYASKVPPGEEVNIEVRPQAEFTGDRLAIPSDIANVFDVVDVRVGKNTQLATCERIPGAAFNTSAVDGTMELDVCEPGITITLRVANTDPANEQDFKAVMYGTVRD